VQVDPIKPTLKAPGTKRLKLKFDILLSNFAFKFNLRRYIKAKSGKLVGMVAAGRVGAVAMIRGRGLHSSTRQLQLSRFGRTSPCPPV
jgi:hypothetical protein